MPCQVIVMGVIMVMSGQDTGLALRRDMMYHTAVVEATVPRHRVVHLRLVLMTNTMTMSLYTD